MLDNGDEHKCACLWQLFQLVSWQLPRGLVVYNKLRIWLHSKKWQGTAINITTLYHLKFMAPMWIFVVSVIILRGLIRFVMWCYCCLFFLLYRTRMKWSSKKTESFVITKNMNRICYFEPGLMVKCRGVV